MPRDLHYKGTGLEHTPSIKSGEKYFRHFLFAKKVAACAGWPTSKLVVHHYSSQIIADIGYGLKNRNKR